jgi:biopolymer transport protein ExbD
LAPIVAVTGTGYTNLTSIMAVKINRGMALGSLSLTPLIDVVFLLLIFFLVATRFEQEERELDLSLPQARNARPLVTKTEELFVNVTDEGKFFLGGRLLDRDALQRVLTHAWMQNPGKQRVVIRADRESRTKHVVAVMNMCNRANIRDFSLAAE